MNQDKPSDQPDRGRRSLLKAAPLGLLTVVAARAAAGEEGPALAPGAVAPAAPASPAGYHETEHIRRYYATAAYW